MHGFEVLFLTLYFFSYREKILELEHNLTHKDEEIRDVKDEYQKKLDSIHQEQVKNKLYNPYHAI